MEETNVHLRIHEIPLATRYGEPNKNGITYSKETLHKAVNDPVFKDHIGSGTLYITKHKYDKKKIQFLSTVFDEITGTVLSINYVNNTANIKMCPEYENLIDFDKVCLGMRYLGKVNPDNTVEGMKIVSFDLLDRETYKEL